MGKIHTLICTKPGIGIKELKKYGFEGNNVFAYWKPHFTCQACEKQYYNDDIDYEVVIQNKQLIIRPNGWTQITEKIQTLLFDMFTDGILVKQVYDEYAGMLGGN